MEPDDDKTRTHVVLSKGTMVSHYRIIEKIGAGGMGEVYLAEDTELDREVALKFLPSHLCQDDDCRARFKREAQAVARLSHANIIHVYEVSEYQGRPFFAMEHVEGQTLRDLIRQDELSVPSIVKLAIRICDGLHEAHETGITHRDIKPSNIIIDKKGRPKLLDFGLATIQGMSKLTKTGSTLGTVGYMSPEQIQGLPSDRRSDIFSLGIVLYELLTGRQPFRRDTEAATLEAILNAKPEPVARYKSGSTDAIQRIIDKALSKNPATRYQHADDFAADLRRELELQSGSSGSTGLVHPIKKRRIKPVLFAAAALVIGGVALIVSYLPPRTRPPVVPSQRQVTFFGNVDLLDISPDGSYFIFTRQSDSNSILYMQDLAGGEPLELLKWKIIQDLRMSPDGSEIAVAGFTDQAAQHGTFVIPRFGGTAHKINDRMCSDLCLDWSPQSSILAIHESCTRTHRDSISLVNVESGETNNIALNIPFQWSHSFCWLRTGDKFVIQTEDSEDNALWAIDTSGSSPVRVLDGHISNIRRSRLVDQIYCLQEQSGKNDLIKISLDPSKLTREGPTRTLMSGHQMTRFSVSADNRRLLYNKQTGSSNLWLVSFGDNPDSVKHTVRQLTQGTGSYLWPSISPDGNHIAYCDRDRQVWIMPINGGKSSRITYSGFQHASPAWSPDGRRIATSCTYDNSTYIVTINGISGGQPTRLEDAVTANSGTVTWLSETRIMYYQSGSKNFDILDLKTNEKTTLLKGDTLGWVFNPVVAHNKEQVALFWNRGDKRGLWVVSSKDSSKTLLMPGWVFPISWSERDDAIFASLPNQSDPDFTSRYICRIDAGSRIVDTVFTIPFDDIEKVSVSPDGRKLVCEAAYVQTDLWLVEDFDPDAE